MLSVAFDDQEVFFSACHHLATWTSFWKHGMCILSYCRKWLCRLAQWTISSWRLMRYCRLPLATKLSLYLCWVWFSKEICSTTYIWWNGSNYWYHDCGGGASGVYPWIWTTKKFSGNNACGMVVSLQLEILNARGQSFPALPLIVQGPYMFCFSINKHCNMETCQRGNPNPIKLRSNLGWYERYFTLFTKPYGKQVLTFRTSAGALIKTS
jgi:hypothetical protein